MPTILDEMVARKRTDVGAARTAVLLDALRRLLGNAHPAWDFATALDRPGEIRVIAEIKAVLKRKRRNKCPSLDAPSREVPSWRSGV